MFNSLTGQPHLQQAARLAPIWGSRSYGSGGLGVRHRVVVLTPPLKQSSQSEATKRDVLSSSDISDLLSAAADGGGDAAAGSLPWAVGAQQLEAQEAELAEYLEARGTTAAKRRALKAQGAAAAVAAEPAAAALGTAASKGGVATKDAEDEVVRKLTTAYNEDG